MRFVSICGLFLALLALIAHPAFGQDQDIYHFDDTDGDAEHWRLLSWKGTFQIDYSDDYDDVVRFFKDRSATFYGDVGIGGVTSPDRALHVDGYVKARGLRAARHLFYANPTSSDGNWRASVVSDGRYQIDRTDRYGLAYLSFDHSIHQARSNVEWAFDARVGIGTTDPGEKLEVNGTTRTKEVIVETDNWPDYVFEEGYNLRSPKELATYVEREGHLPALPSAEEVEDEGQTVGEVQRGLVQTVEELALYAIDQRRRADSLRTTMNERHARQQAQIEALQRQLDRLRTQVSGPQTSSTDK